MTSGVLNGKNGKRIFGTDGIRGVANQYPMTVELVTEVGRAIAFVLGKKKGKNKVLIGKDTRISGYMLESALGAGLNSMGADTLLVGPMPTPGVAFLTHSMRADVGIVISASHNPYQDNGIKIFSRDGFKLPDDVEREIESKMFTEELKSCRPTAEHVGKAFRIEDARGRYIVFLKSTFPSHLSLDGMKIVIDCANGAAYKIAPTVFAELGAEVIGLGIEPNGFNINSGCGALYPELIAEKVKAEKADIGIALDGDADRAVLVDEKGEIVDGDHILAVCAEQMAGEGRLAGKTVVGTSMTNVGLDVFLEKRGISLVRTDVGDRYVVEEMRRNNFFLGGEPSGHIIFLDKNTTGDGIITALQVLAVMRETGAKLSDLRKKLNKFPQIIKNLKVSTKPPLSDLPRTMEQVDKIREMLGGRGRVVVRYSGTEPLARVMVEGESIDLIESYADEIIKTMADEIA